MYVHWMVVTGQQDQCEHVKIGPLGKRTEKGVQRYGGGPDR